MGFPSELYPCRHCGCPAVIGSLQNALALSFCHNCQDLNHHFPHRTFCAEAVFQKPDGYPFLIAGVNDMDHIHCIASETVHFGTDNDVIFLSPAKQAL